MDSNIPYDFDDPHYHTKNNVLVPEIESNKYIYYEPQIVQRTVTYDDSSSYEIVSSPPMILKPSGCSNNIAWPAVIILISGTILVIYSAVTTHITPSRRIFGSILLAIWTIIWAILLWVLWRECHTQACWWLSLIPLTLMFALFIVIIVFNIGGD